MNTQSMNSHATLIGIFIALAGAQLHAQSFETAIDSPSSSANINSVVLFDTAGTLIGDYDPATNPGGTQTRPGFFGGSGNQPIDTSTTLDANTVLDTNPDGNFLLTPDFDLLSVEIDGLSIDLLNGQTGATDLSITMLYNSFHTVSPTFLYPGGVPITLPLGQIGGIDQATLTGTGVGTGTLTPTNLPDLYDLNVVVPAQLDMLIAQSLPGSDPTQTPISLPILLPIVGQLEVLSDGSIVVTIGITPEPVSTVVPIDGVTLPEIPFELPTFGTETASVVFALTPQSISIDAQIDLNLVALGNNPACAADFNNDGQLNFFDVSAFLGAFSSMDAAADMTGDGNFNFFDVSAFLVAFADGCP